MSEHIGTVEILRTRVYPLDPQAARFTEHHTTVVVEPGEYGLYRDGISTYWLLRGVVNGRGIQRMGDGWFAMRGHDAAVGPEVAFPSRPFGPDEWAELLASPEFTDGHAEQRLRVRLFDQVASR